MKPIARDKKKLKQNEYGMWQADVDGLPFEFEQWGAEDSSDMLADIICVIGEPLMSAAAAVGMGGGMSTTITPDLAGTVVRSLMANLKSDKQKVLSILRDLTSKGVICKGTKVEFNEFFKGKFGLMFKVAKAGFEVQYGDFSDAVLTPLGFTAQGKTAVSKQRG